MSIRLVLAALSAAAVSLAAAAQPASFALTIRLHPGDRIVKRSDIVDRIEWVLPPARLAAFAAQGVIVNEETRTSTLGSGSISAATKGAVRVSGTIGTTVRDVPRHRTNVSHVFASALVSSRNVEVGSTMYYLEDAAMIDLPAAPVRIGSRWTTRQRVLTTLGSGSARFDHVVAAVESGRVRIDVTGSGTITGKEYNLPKLLPGTINLTGSAWFDPASGLLAQESYLI